MTSTPGQRGALDPTTREDLRRQLRELLVKFAVKHGTFTLVSGTVNDFYIDCRIVTMLPRAMHLIGALMLDAISDLLEVHAVGGLTLGADPIAAAVAMMSTGTIREIPMFIVRKEPKGHGTQRLIEGAFPTQSGATVVIVDDVITKGGSALMAIRAVRETGTRIACVAFIVDRQEGGADVLRGMGFEVRSLFTRRDFDTEG